MIRHLWHRLTGLLTGRDLERDATRHQAAADGHCCGTLARGVAAPFPDDVMPRG